MLEKVTVRGFQSHINTEIEFDMGMNLVRGDNASGKSALRRAIFWVLKNKPSGASFINWNYGDNEVCEVTIVYNGNTITRRRSRNGKVNEYVLNGEVLTGFGVNVPEPIQDLLGLDDTNIELQHSSLFMLTESPPEMARRLNKLTNLEDIDKAFTSIRRRKLDNSREIKNAEQKLEDLNTELASYAFLEEAGKVITELEEKQVLLKGIEQKYNTINALIAEIIEAKSKLTEDAPVDVKTLDTAVTLVKTLYKEYDEIDTLLMTINKLEILIVPHHISLETINNSRDNLVALFMDARQLNMLFKDIRENTIVPLPSISIDELNLTNVKKAINEYMEVQTLLNRLDETKTMLEAGEYKLSHLQEEYDKIKPETCPLCGSPFGGNHESNHVG